MKTRSIIIIIATLILGFILGMLTSAEIRHRKLKPMSFFLSEERFRDGVFSVINPAEDQKLKLEKVIEEYSKRNRELQADFRKNMDDFMKDLWKEMEPILTPEQIEKLLNMEKKRAEFYRQGRGWHNDSTRGGPDSRNRMRPPGDSTRMWPQGDSARMRMFSDSSRMRGFERPPGGQPY